jgi:hypothetical protein
MLMTPALAALIGSLALAFPAPAWQPDYATAYAQSSTAHKPLAVFIGHGPGGPGRVVAKGLTPEQNKTLAVKYIALYVDADSVEGKTLASAFRISEGLVISDATGGLQALKHEGVLTSPELMEYLTTFSDTTRAVSTTVLGGKLRPVWTYQTEPTRPHPVANTLNYVGGIIFNSGST